MDRQTSTDRTDIDRQRQISTDRHRQTEQILTHRQTETDIDWDTHLTNHPYALRISARCDLGAIHISELDRSKSKAIWMWTLKCEMRSIQDRSKWVWTLSQSELRSISDRSNLDRSWCEWPRATLDFQLLSHLPNCIHNLTEHAKPRMTIRQKIVRGKTLFASKPEIGPINRSVNWAD